MFLGGAGFFLRLAQSFSLLMLFVGAEEGKGVDHKENQVRENKG